MKSLKGTNIPIFDNPSPVARRTISSLASAGHGRSVPERELVESARRLIRARVEISKHIPQRVLKDAAWDILLELFVNGEEGGIVHIKKLILACGMTSTSAMRLIDRLDDAGLIARLPDPLDHRRVIVSLSERGRRAMVALLHGISETPDQDISHRPIPFAPRR